MGTEVNNILSIPIKLESSDQECVMGTSLMIVSFLQENWITKKGRIENRRNLFIVFILAWIKNIASDVIVLSFNDQPCKGQTIVFKKQEKWELLYVPPPFFGWNCQNVYLKMVFENIKKGDHQGRLYVDRRGYFTQLHLQQYLINPTVMVLIPLSFLNWWLIYSAKC